MTIVLPWSILGAESTRPAPKHLELRLRPSVPTSGAVRRPVQLTDSGKRLKKGGLCCPEVFGPLRPGPTLRDQFQATYDGRPHGKSTFTPGPPYERFGHIPLPRPFVHPWLTTRARPMLLETTGLTEPQLEGVLKLELAVTGDGAQLVDVEPTTKVGPEVAWGAEALCALGLDDSALIRDLAVLPCGLRGLRPFDDPQMILFDVDALYARVINSAGRLERMVRLGSPRLLVHNEARLVQIYLDFLFDNERFDRPLTDPYCRTMCSLAGWMAHTPEDALEAFTWLDARFAEDPKALEGPLPGEVYWALTYARALHLEVTPR